MSWRVLLINPNTSAATTAMMVGIAQAAAGAGMQVTGATASSGPAMITDPLALEASAAEVAAMAAAARGRFDGMIVAAFGDPGLAAARTASGVPVVGIAESAMRAAAEGGRRFGVATTTPGLAEVIGARVAALGLGGCYTGLRLTNEAPLDLARDPSRQQAALELAVRACIGQDGAQAVIIGGGPLGEAARALAPLFDVPVIGPIPAAVRALAAMLASRGTTP